MHLNTFLQFLQMVIRINDEDIQLLLRFDSKFPKTELRMITLNTAQIFTEILDESHAMVLAGGTMEPIAEFQELFKSLKDSEIAKFVWDHVIKDEQYQTIVVS